jgi:hypothetical protein
MTLGAHIKSKRASRASALPPDTPQQRASSARADIRYLTNEIEHHDRLASSLRKDREKAKAKLARALKAGAV